MIITNTITETTTEREILKTRTHDRTFNFLLCDQTDRIGIYQEVVTTTHKNGKVATATAIRAYYLGFANFPKAEAFEEYCKRKFPALDAYSTHCEARLAKRLTNHPIEVKIRNLSPIAEELEEFIRQCIKKELATPTPAPMTREQLQKKLKRLY